MTVFLIANMAPLMFAALVVFLLLGYPVAFSLAANGLLFGIIAIELGLLEPQLLQALPERVFGTVFFLLPMTIVIMYLSWGVFMRSWNINEVSSNAGGLVIWPARLLVPAGFFLLSLQGVSQLIKLVAYLRGAGPDPNIRHDPAEAEKALAEAILRERGEKS